MADKCAVILLSGGVDSATAAAMAREQGFELHALSFRYGQRTSASSSRRRRSQIICTPDRTKKLPSIFARSVVPR